MNKPKVTFELKQDDLDFIKENDSKFSNYGITHIELNRNLSSIICYVEYYESLLIHSFERKIGNNLIFNYDKHLIIHRPPTIKWYKTLTIGTNSIEIYKDGSAILSTAKGSFEISEHWIEHIPQKIYKVSDSCEILRYLDTLSLDYTDKSYNIFKLKQDIENLIIKELKEKDEYERYDKIEIDKLTLIRKFLSNKYRYIARLLKKEYLDAQTTMELEHILESIKRYASAFELRL
jgi:hypothetical protein